MDPDEEQQQEQQQEEVAPNDIIGLAAGMNLADFGLENHAQALAQAIPGLPQEWLQPGYQLSAESEQHLLAYMINNMAHHARLVMNISEDERRKALAIKAAVQAEDDLDEIPDMRYAQLALIDGDNIEAAVTRVRHFQLFKAEYEVTDTVEQGCRAMEDFFDQHPNAILSVSYNMIDGNYCYIYDQARFDPNVIQTEEQWRITQLYCYYLFHAMSPDLFAIRQGCVFIGECEGYTWTIVNVETIRRMWDEVFSVYPMRIREIKCFHSGVIANMLLSMLKPFFPKSLQSRINLGCQFEGRLDTFYAVPNWEAAAERTQNDIRNFLERRYANERSFIL